MAATLLLNLYRTGPDLCSSCQKQLSVSADVEMKFKDADPYLENTIHGTVPVVVHGNGPAKRILNSLGNYIAKAWNTNDQVT